MIQNPNNSLVKFIKAIMKCTLTLIMFVVILCGTITANAQDVSMLFEQLDPSVVTIQVKEYKVKNQQITSLAGLGSGVIISADGLILTAAHVVSFANEVLVKLKDETTIQADVLISSLTADIALLKLRTIPAQLTPVVMGNSDLTKIGQEIILIGAPLGFEHSLSVGHVSKKFKKNILTNGENAGFIQTDASINQGNSGGPMFNLDGELIGIVSFILSKSGGFEGLGFAADINSIKKTLLDMKAFWTGFEGIFLNEAMAGIFNVPQKSGVLVQHVTPDSFASKIGLKPGLLQAEIFGQKLWIGGDIILSIQGLSCNEPHDLGTIKAQIETLIEGDKVLIEVLRKGKKVTLEGNFIE
jgi:S1-C subfamily serine protease